MRISNKIKSIISVVLSLALISSVPFVSHAADSGVSSEEGQTAYNFLMAVGAMDPDEDAYNPTVKLTRAHFVKMAVHLAGDAPNVLVSDDEVFSDVTPSTKYENYIETAYRTGYISGSTSGLFQPESEITLAQALKILCNILGYQQFAEAKGGFPGGYIIAAQRADLLEGISSADDLGLDMATAMVLLRNCAEADIMQVVSIGDSLEMASVGGESLLSERHEVAMTEGIITANGYTDLYAQKSELDVNQIMIGDMIFNEAESGAQDYIGYHVKLYYDNSQNRPVRNALFAELTDENKLLTAPGGDYITVDGDLIRCYTDDDSSRKVTLSTRATYILNGKMAVMTPEDLENVIKGEITFVSNDGDSKYDVVIVTSYETVIAAGVSAVSEVVVSKDGFAVYLEEDSDEYTFEIIKDGKQITIADIAADNVLLISEGIGNGLCHKKVIVSDKVMNTSFDSLDEDEAEIAGVTYKVDSSVHSKVEPGRTYKILFDAFDNISYVYYENDIVYGYLYAIKKEGLGSPMCRIFTENERWVDLAFYDKVKYNGESVSADELYNELIAMDSFNQMIRYLVNADRKLIQLETAQDIPIGSENEKTAAENDNFRISYSGSQMYRSATRSFNGVFFADSNAKIFVIPSDMSRENFKMVSISDFVGDTSYSVTAYDVDKYLNCKVMVMNTEFKRSINSTDKFMVVKGVGSILNSDGDASPAIRGWWNGIEFTFAVKVGDGGVDSEVVNSLKEGDLALFTFDDKSNINVLNVYASDSDYYMSAGLYSVCTVMSGVVSECDYANKRLRITYSEDGDEVGIAYANSTTFHLYNTQDKTYSKSSAAEILPGDKIYVNMRYLQCSDVVIIRR